MNVKVSDGKFIKIPVYWIWWYYFTSPRALIWMKNYKCTAGRSQRVLSAEAETPFPELPNSQYQAKSKAISFFAKLVKFSSIFSISTKTAKPSQVILVPRGFLVFQPYFCHYSVQLASFVPISQVPSKFAQCYNQLQKYLKHCKLYFGINGPSIILCFWSPLHHLSKLLAIQDHGQNLEEQLWMGGRREVGIIYHRPVISSVLKQERSFVHGIVSTFLPLVVACFEEWTLVLSQSEIEKYFECYFFLTVKTVYTGVYCQ